MLTGSLRLRFHSIDYDSGEFEVLIRFRDLTARLSWYAERDAWQEFGRQLQQWPLTDRATFTGRTAEGELRLTAFQYDDNGHTALRVLVDDGEVWPGPYRLEFALPVDGAGLAALGRQLEHWPQGEADELCWEAYES